MQSIPNNTINTDRSLDNHLKLQSAESVGIKFEIAGIGARSHAFVIDWHIRLLLALTWLFVCGVALFSLQGLINSPWDNASSAVLYLWVLPAGILYLFYHPVLEILMSGRTPGKRIAGVKLVTLKGLTPSSGALLLRNIFRLIDSLPGFYILGLGVVAFTQHQVRIGDLATNLVLVYEHKIDQKELKQISRLALNSTLDSKDQALLLDLIQRWKYLQIQDRIRLGEQFLIKIGASLSNTDSNEKKHSALILIKLKQLADNEEL